MKIYLVTNNSREDFLIKEMRSFPCNTLWRVTLSVIDKKSRHELLVPPPYLQTFSQAEEILLKEIETLTHTLDCLKNQLTSIRNTRTPLAKLLDEPCNNELSLLSAYNHLSSYLSEVKIIELDVEP